MIAFGLTAMVPVGKFVRTKTRLVLLYHTPRLEIRGSSNKSWTLRLLIRNVDADTNFNGTTKISINGDIINKINGEKEITEWPTIWNKRSKYFSKCF